MISLLFSSGLTMRRELMKVSSGLRVLVFQRKSGFALRDDIIKGILSGYGPGNSWHEQMYKGQLMVSKDSAQ